MSSDRRASRIAPEVLELVFSRLKEKAIQRAEEEKHAASRQQRRTIDALRSRIKHLDPPVEATDTWEAVRPRVENTEEFKELETDEVRRIAFDKVIRRLKEKEEEDRERRNRDKERSKDRSRRRHDTLDYADSPVRSTTPRPVNDSLESADPYEADRRKAQADRERNYRSRDGHDSRSRYRERDRAGEREHRRDRDRDRDRDRERERERERERDREDRRSHRRYRLSRDEHEYDYDDERSRDRSGGPPPPRRDSYYRGGRSMSASVRDFRRGSIPAPSAAIPPRGYERDERLYSTRADPNSHVEELDYGGDSTATTAATTPVNGDARGSKKESGAGLALPASYEQKRRRGDSNAINGNGADGYEPTPTKKRRGDVDADNHIVTAATAAVAAEDHAVHSGSEEGEIED